MLQVLSEQALNDFIDFGRQMIVSCDIDPNYPVLKALMKNLQLSEHDKLYFMFVFVAHYDFTSALQYWDSPAVNYPKTTQRRGLRSNSKFLQHMNYLTERRAFLYPFLMEKVITSDDPKVNWKRVCAFIEAMPHNGRWAGYKIAEILQKSFDYPLEAPDMGNDYSTGPIGGLVKMFGKPPDGRWPQVAWADEGGAILQQAFTARTGQEVGIEEIETMLCDYKALAAGRFYVGFEIDEMLEHITKARKRGVPERILEPLLAARYESLPHNYLGELHGREGFEDSRKAIYKETGKIVIRNGER